MKVSGIHIRNFSVIKSLEIEISGTTVPIAKTFALIDTTKKETI